MLKYKLHLTAQGFERRSPQMCDILPVKQDAAAIAVKQAQDHPGQGCFPAPAVSHQPKGCPRFDMKRNIPHRFYPASKAGHKGFSEMFNRQHGDSTSLSARSAPA